MCESPDPSHNCTEEISGSEDGEDGDDGENTISEEKLRDRNTGRSDQTAEKIFNITIEKLVIEDGGFMADGGNNEDIERQPNYTTGGAEDFGFLDLLKNLYEDYYPWGVILLVLILGLMVLTLGLLKLDIILEILGYVLL